MIFTDNQTKPPTQFLTNGSGDYLLDTSDLPKCSNCSCDNTEKLEGGQEKPEYKRYKLVDVPFGGSEHIAQECGIYAGTILQLPDGTYAKISCPFGGFSSLQGLTVDDLPAPLDGSAQFDLGMLLGLLGEDGSYILNADGSITISFKIPENSTARSYDILFWNPTLSDGEGGWFQLPPFEEGASFRVGEDGRMIYSGVQTGSEYVTATINFSGYFVLVSN